MLEKLNEYRIEQNHGTCQVIPAPFAVFLNRHDNQTYLEPDISIVCDISKLDERGCHGSPDWVIEIVSPSSRPRDYLTKLIKYQSSGIREYWIVDPETKITTVYAFEQDMVAQYIFGKNVPVGIFPGFSINIE